MKKYLVAAAGVVAAAVIAAPSAVGASTETVAKPSTAPLPRPATAPAPSTAPLPKSVTVPAAAPTRIRTVRSGERVDAGLGYTVWLTEDGKHWAGPDGYENFRSVVDGNIDRSQPGVSHQSEGSEAGTFHSGLFYGTRKAGRVELTDAEGHRTVATLLALPGHPDWGVWYARTGAGPKSSGLGVALYDRAGKLLAELPAMEY
ncbi:hypothetical protein ACF07V_37330 [Streptomyces sp. NPDC015661]|uniref:hypothetical protein n=1 Tax=Streptomyces sp. NPDC015661 TaxID=3364961 RepID=UPI003703012D